MQFNWNHAGTFLVAAEEGSLSAAARRLDLTQPTVGRQIASLEQELGITLFERVGKGLLLTESGRSLLEYVRQMREAADKISLVASGQATSLEGLVSVSVGELDAFFRLPALVTSLRRRQPGITLNIIASNYVSDLKRREADVALRSFRPTQLELITKKVAEERIWMYGTKELVEKLPQSPYHEDFQSASILGFTQKHRLIDWLKKRKWCVSEDSFPIICQSQLCQWELAKRGAGFIFLPEDIGDAEGSLYRSFEELGPIEVLSLWLVCHRELHTSQRVRYIFDAMADHYQQCLCD